MDAGGMNWARYIRMTSVNGEIVVRPQEIRIPLADNFETTAPPFWTRTFLVWQPVRFEGKWVTAGGSTWTLRKDMPRRLPIARIKVTKEFSIDRMLMTQRHWEPDLFEMLKAYGGLEYTEEHPPVEGVLAISQIDGLAMMAKLAEFEALARVDEVETH